VAVFLFLKLQNINTTNYFKIIKKLDVSYVIKECDLHNDRAQAIFSGDKQKH
jgi:hypothetical protein